MNKRTQHNGAVLQVPHGRIELPAFLPDATRGVVRALDSLDLVNCGTIALQTNAFHLMQKPGSSTIMALGGLHKMLSWELPIITDSGGFQIYSLIRQNPKSGSITKQGLTFRTENSRKLNLTPEKSVQLQMNYGADVVICLDDCTEVGDPLQTQIESVARTIEWAKRCKTEFEQRLEQIKDTQSQRPLIFAVIQGGGYRELRKKCAEALLEIGFDGFGFGGWPLDGKGTLLADLIGYTRELIPKEYAFHALGVGQPANVLECANLGCTLFDSVMPTRDARHGRLSAFTGDGKELNGDWYSYIYIQDEKHIKSNLPLSEYCDCLCCRTYSLGYLHHLFKINDHLYFRLATIHNLRFMSQLMERIRSRRNVQR